MEELFRKENPEIVLDATHPYAAEVTKNIRTACESAGVLYQRILRPEGEKNSEAIYVESTEEAAAFLIGTHDFKSFCGNSRMKKSTVRRIDSIEFEAAGESRLHIRYTGNGFLQQMVRILTGTLIEAGLGKREPEQMKAVLEALNRQAAGFTAPAQGLFLEKVEYGEGK